MTTTITASHPFTIERSVKSTAVRYISIIPGEALGYNVIITFHGDNKYVYNVEDCAPAEKWFHLLSDDADCAATSWGAEVNRAIRHGDIELADW